MLRIPSLSLVLLTTLLFGLVTVNCHKLRCNRPHEKYACGSACQTRCDNIGMPCPIINIKCNDACYCVDGYARNGDDDAECIPISHCPSRCD